MINIYNEQIKKQNCYYGNYDISSNNYFNYRKFKMKQDNKNIKIIVVIIIYKVLGY